MTERLPPCVSIKLCIRKARAIPKLPQAPNPPFIGNLLSKNLAEQCRQWSTSLGAVFQIQLGFKSILVINSVAAAQATLVKQGAILGLQT